MQEVDAARTERQRQQIEAHLLERAPVYADIWKVGVNTALRISDLLSLTMVNVRGLDPALPALKLIEQRTGKLRKIVLIKRHWMSCPTGQWNTLITCGCFNRMR